MSYHIIDISTNDVSLSVRDGQLICRNPDEGVRKLPMEDIGAILVNCFSAQFHSSFLVEAERKRATQFRKFLLDDGYDMIQFSVYARPCVTFARQQTHLRRLELNVPPEGSVRAIFVTRAQWERAYSIMGRPAKAVSPERFPTQMQFW